MMETNEIVHEILKNYGIRERSINNIIVLSLRRGHSITEEWAHEYGKKWVELNHGIKPL